MIYKEKNQPYNKFTRKKPPEYTGGFSCIDLIAYLICILQPAF